MPYHLHLPMGEDTIVEILVPGKQYAPARYVRPSTGSHRANRFVLAPDSARPSLT